MPRCSPRCDGPWRCTPNAITGGGARHVRTGVFRAASVYVTRRPDVCPVGWRPLRASEAPLWSAQVPSRNSGAEGAITVRTDRRELWGAWRHGWLPRRPGCSARSTGTRCRSRPMRRHPHPTPQVVTTRSAAGGPSAPCRPPTKGPVRRRCRPPHQIAQQVRVHAVLRVGHAGARLAVDRLHAHPPHETTHAVPSGNHALAAQMPRHLPAAVERMLQMQLVQAAHQRQFRRAFAQRLVVLRGTAHAHQRALPGQR